MGGRCTPSSHLIRGCVGPRADLVSSRETKSLIPIGEVISKGRDASFNLLKPTGYVLHHQFNIQQLYALPTLYLCVLYLSENKQRLVPLTA